MDENTLRDEVANDLRKMFAEEKPYTDSERLAAYEILLAKIRTDLALFFSHAVKMIDLIDEEINK